MPLAVHGRDGQRDRAEVLVGIRAAARAVLVAHDVIDVGDPAGAPARDVHEVADFQIVHRVAAGDLHFDLRLLLAVRRRLDKVNRRIGLDGDDVDGIRFAASTVGGCDHAEDGTGIHPLARLHEIARDHLQGVLRVLLHLRPQLCRAIRLPLRVQEPQHHGEQQHRHDHADEHLDEGETSLARGDRARAPGARQKLTIRDTSHRHRQFPV